MGILRQRQARARHGAAAPLVEAPCKPYQASWVPIPPRGGSQIPDPGKDRAHLGSDRHWRWDPVLAWDPLPQGVLRALPSWPRVLSLQPRWSSQT